MHAIANSLVPIQLSRLSLIVFNCLTLLMHTRNGTVQMRESGVASRNDAISSNTAKNTQQGSSLLYVRQLVILPYLVPISEYVPTKYLSCDVPDCDDTVLTGSFLMTPFSSMLLASIFEE